MHPAYSSLRSKPRKPNSVLLRALRREQCSLCRDSRYAGAKRTHRHNSRLATRRRSLRRQQTSSLPLECLCPSGCALCPRLRLSSLPLVGESRQLTVPARSFFSLAPLTQNPTGPRDTKLETQRLLLRNYVATAQ